MTTSKRYCPRCKTAKPMRKAGIVYYYEGGKQRYECRNKRCRRFTVYPLRVRK